MKFVKDVLQIIPNSVFEVLENVIKLLTVNIKEIPPKVNKTDLKEYWQP